MRQRRVVRCLTQAQAARELGVTKSTIGNWESGRSQPALRFLPAIVEFLGYDPLAEAGSLGERLVGLRRVRGWTQKELARRLNVDPSTLGRWERGEREPAGRYLEQIEAILREFVIEEERREARD